MKSRIIATILTAILLPCASFAQGQGTDTYYLQQILKEQQNQTNIMQQQLHIQQQELQLLQQHDKEQPQKKKKQQAQQPQK